MVIGLAVLVWLITAATNIEKLSVSRAVVLVVLCVSHWPVYSMLTMRYV
jgi:hypothetical protein